MKQNLFNSIPDSFLNKWQEIADLLATIIGVSAALIMKTENEFMEVFVSSKTKKNPYHVGDKEKWYGLYCETVIKSQKKLLIPNALKDKNWDKNPDIKLGMIAYLGFPINYPDNQPFGTICVLDNKEKSFLPVHKKLILHFKKVIELDLALMQTFEIKTNDLSHTISEQQSQLLIKNIELNTAKEKAEESEKRLKQAQQTAQLGNWELDIINDTLHWSDEIYQIFNCQPQEFKATYEGFLEFIHPDDREMVNDAYTHSLQTQKPYDIAHRLLMKNGKIKYVQETCKTTFDENGKPLISKGIVLDITKLKEQENKLHQYSKKLEEANATKERFISILGHDLRSPFNTLLGFSNLLIKNIDKYDKEKIKKQAEAINKTANQTFNLLNNLLEWSRSQQDKIPFNPKTTNVYFLVYETYLLLNNSSEAKQISIDLDVPEEINAKVDSEMIKTIIRNLLSNAIKFTPEHGKISISASNNQEFVQVEISDNGTGMAPETLDSLFKIGKTESKPGTKGERGTGFGLLLCKEFTEKHGGTLWAESEVQKGSNFKFTIPSNNLDSL